MKINIYHENSFVFIDLLHAYYAVSQKVFWQLMAGFVWLGHIPWFENFWELPIQWVALSKVNFFFSLWLQYFDDFSTKSIENIHNQKLCDSDSPYRIS